MSQNNDADVLIIGAGPSGAVAAAGLVRLGYKVLVLEKMHFPRFVIGESLLPSLMPMLDEVGLGDAVRAGGFQRKFGARFTWGECNVFIDFRDNFGNFNGEVYEVKRAEFDKLLIDAAEAQGVEVCYGQTVTDCQIDEKGVVLAVESENGEKYQVRGQFVLDASGYGRVLPRLLNLETPSDLKPRQVYSVHIRDKIDSANYDRDLITLATLPNDRQKWMWLIPFSDGTASTGVLGTPEEMECENPLAQIRAHADKVPYFKEILVNADWEIGAPVRCFKNFSANVKALCGERFALLGNAAEFLDPVFSSGVAIAVYSARLATQLLDRQFKGEQVDWQTAFEEEMRFGIRVFKTYVDGWYDGRFQDVIYSVKDSPDIRRYISSILAGYAWDRSNPFVVEPERRLNMVANAIREYGLAHP
ncbi:NAD(P)/FAD-dependent oxidoreductase [Suttonella ornithocola]|uniref:Geranylgeranyl reductase family n=1 Tax=Suttonella ornithocola TaxID=279832 RepID=A0A380MYV5_9GAMM|nr:NAD(P)/FAD-dependent oxidoreductase [Suttonella ornithocola]SUO97216.1 geranylgeranyl reductase family [Suttonella ornithocola]